MPIDYEKIRNENIEEYGKGTRHLAFLGRLYTDRTHFIFELLQNAEDAKATKIQFKLFEDRLEVFHDGRLFNERDVRGICGVGEGTKWEDLTQIGKFGIGFKSVYAYTINPEIHSGHDHFRIEHYVRPYPVAAKDAGDRFTTLFIFTFNQGEVSANIACSEIGIRLRNLNVTTLLFLRNIAEIEYILPDQTKGAYVRDAKVRNSARQVTVVGQNVEVEESQTWLIFERPIQIQGSNSKQVFVEVGFQIEYNNKNSTEAIKKIPKSPLIVYFPTEKDTRFGFLIQGPYRTTPSRDNISPYDDWNRFLVKETAQLLSDSLFELRSLNLLTVATFQTLPIRMSEFPPDGMFYPIVDAVRQTLMTKDLLPADDGSFISASTAKIARGSDLRELLKAELLSQLFKSQIAVKWLSREITQDRTPDLHSYLNQELGVEEITAESFARKISEGFLIEQTDRWVVEFYKFLSSRKDLWKPRKGEYWREEPEGILRSKPIIRLQNGSHVSPFTDKKPNAYLAKNEEAVEYPVVKISIAQDEDAYKFLKHNLEIPELDIVEVVLEKIIGKYVVKNLSGLSLSEHLEDIELIKKAYSTDSQTKKMRLKEKLSGTSFVFAYNPQTNKRFFKKPSEIYLSTHDLDVYFSGNIEVGFPVSEYNQDFLKVLKDLGSNEKVRVTKRSETMYSRYVTIADTHGWHERGLNGFDPDIEVDGLENALISPTLQKTAFIWNSILLPNKDCIYGVVESSSRQNFMWSSRTNKYSSHFGALLVNAAWLPDSRGDMHKPDEITLDDLPSEFQRDESLAGIFLKKNLPPEIDTEEIENPHETALNLLSGGDIQKKMRIELFASASEEDQEKLIKLLSPESSQEPMISFNEGLQNLDRVQKGTSIHEADNEEKSSVSDVEGYLNKIKDEIDEQVEEHKSVPQKKKFSVVKESSSNAEARFFLYEEYKGHCQITGNTFPKAARNTDGESLNYFEACCLLPYRNADYLNNAGNMMCVSADALAKLKHASVIGLSEGIKEAIKVFKENSQNTTSVSVKFRLAGEECSITWSQRHFMRLVALYEIT